MSSKPVERSVNRRDRILDIINQTLRYGYSSLEELAIRHNTSKDSIRRDFKLIEKTIGSDIFYHYHGKLIYAKRRA